MILSKGGQAVALEALKHEAKRLGEQAVETEAILKKGNMDEKLIEKLLSALREDVKAIERDIAAVKSNVDPSTTITYPHWNPPVTMPLWQGTIGDTISGVACPR